MKIYFLALKQIFKITFSILLFISLPLVVFTFVASKTNKLAGIQSFVVMTGSMTPTMPIGSIVYTIPSYIYVPGDVIAFREGDVVVTHRIVAVTKDGYTTKGDANNAVDSKIVTKSQVIGKSAFRVLNAGKLILFMRTVPGFIVLLVLPTLVFIGIEIMTIKKELEKEIRKKIIKQLKDNFVIPAPDRSPG